jgi:hypothetical protein
VSSALLPDLLEGSQHRHRHDDGPCDPGARGDRVRLPVAVVQDDAEEMTGLNYFIEVRGSGAPGITW